MIRNSQIQFAAPEEIKKFQEERLREELRSTRKGGIWLCAFPVKVH